MRAIAALCMLAVLGGTASADEPDAIELRLGTQAVDGSRYMIDILAMSQQIEKRTHHRVRLHWITGGQLGDETALADLVAHGKLDGGGFSQTGLAAFAPAMAAWGTPALFAGYAEVDRATAALGDDVRAQFGAHDAVFVMWADLGFAHGFSTTPLAQRGGVRDLFARAAPRLGAPLDATLAHAIATRAATAWAVPPLFQLALGADTAVAMVDAPYDYVVGGLVISRRAWARLTPADQTAIEDVARASEPRLRARWRAETVRGVAALEKAGVAIYRTSAAEREALARALRPATLDGFAARIAAAR